MCQWVRRKFSGVFTVTWASGGPLKLSAACAPRESVVIFEVPSLGLQCRPCRTQGYDAEAKETYYGSKRDLLRRQCRTQGYDAEQLVPDMTPAPCENTLIRGGVVLVDMTLGFRENDSGFREEIRVGFQSTFVRQPCTTFGTVGPTFIR